MNKRLLAGLCAVVMLSGLVGCGPKEPKQENEQTTTEQSKKNDIPTGVHTNSLISLFMILISSIGLLLTNVVKKRES